MARTAWPVPADVTAFLTEMGVSAGNLNVQDAIDDAIATWDSDTGYRPFLADTADVTRSYTRPAFRGPNLILDNGLTAAPTSVVTNGATLTLNTQYYLKPDNAIVMGIPIEEIEFLVSPWTYGSGGDFGLVDDIVAGTVYVTGKWGYATNIPADAWRTVLLGAAARLYTPLWVKQTSGLSKIAIGAGDLEVTYDRKTSFDLTVADYWKKKAYDYHRRNVS